MERTAETVSAKNKELLEESKILDEEIARYEQMIQDVETETN